jgi:hypothetical protein
MNDNDKPGTVATQDNHLYRTFDPLKAKELISKGLSDQDVAKHFNCDRSTINRFRNKHADELARFAVLRNDPNLLLEMSANKSIQLSERIIDYYLTKDVESFNALKDEVKIKLLKAAGLDGAIKLDKRSGDPSKVPQVINMQMIWQKIEQKYDKEKPPLKAHMTPPTEDIIIESE